MTTIVQGVNAAERVDTVSRPTSRAGGDGGERNRLRAHRPTSVLHDGPHRSGGTVLDHAMTAMTDPEWTALRLDTGLVAVAPWQSALTGIAFADPDDVSPTLFPALYELCEIDPAEWFICALYVCAPDDRTTSDRAGQVTAIRREEIGSSSPWQAVEFHIYGCSAGHLLGLLLSSSSAYFRFGGPGGCVVTQSVNRIVSKTSVGDAT